MIFLRPSLTPCQWLCHTPAALHPPPPCPARRPACPHSPSHLKLSHRGRNSTSMEKLSTIFEIDTKYLSLNRTVWTKLDRQYFLVLYTPPSVIIGLLLWKSWHIIFQNLKTFKISQKNLKFSILFPKLPKPQRGRHRDQRGPASFLKMSKMAHLSCPWSIALCVYQ